MKKHHTKWLLILILASFSIGMNAQTEKDRWEEPIPLSDEYLITNAAIQVSPTKRLEGYDIWIADGKIKKVAQNINAPLVVNRLEADSFIIYSGFIDALSNAGIKDPEKDERTVERRGNPPDDLAGITPDRSATELFDPTDKSIKALRSQGVTAAHTVPKGKMLPGQGAIVLLGEGAAHEQILLDEHSCFAQLKGSGRMYPSTVIGVTAKWRELYRDANNALQHANNFKQTPSASPRPKYSKAVMGLFPVVEKRQKVYFNASKALSAYRIFTLQKELGFNLVLSNLKEAWLLEERLKDYKGDLILSLKLPKKMEEQDSSKIAEQGAEEIAFWARKKEVYDNHLGQSKQISDLGLKYGFSSLDISAKDFKESLVRIVEAGLSESDALAALTVYPAKLFGVSSLMGTIEEGKLANLILTDASYFEKDSKILHVFVEGKKFDITDKKKGSGDKVDADNMDHIIGEWKWEVQMMGETISGAMTLTNNSGSLEGTMSSDMDDELVTLDDLKYDGETLEFTYNVQGISAAISMEVSDGEATGTADVEGMGQAAISASRSTKPE